MGMLDDVVERLWGPWCQANHATGSTCWAKVPLDQPGSICDKCWDRLTSGKTDATVRAELARDPDLPPDVVDKLVSDVSSTVRVAIAENEKALLEEHIDVLVANRSDTRVLMRLARRSDLSVQQQHLLAQAEHEAVKRTLIGNPTIDPALRTQMVGY